jgi:hypothetical protein
MELLVTTCWDTTISSDALGPVTVYLYTSKTLCSVYIDRTLIPSKTPRECLFLFLVSTSLLVSFFLPAGPNFL